MFDFSAARPAKDSTDEAPSSFDDACAGGDRRHPERSSKPKNRPPQSPEPKAPQARQATLEDASKHEIPPNYSLKNWDPDAEPIVLLGSVYDANSLGKWIYDWTVYAYGNRAAETETSGELWLLIIMLARRLRVSAKFVSQSVGIESVKQGKDKEMVEEFIESGLASDGEISKPSGKV